MTAIGTDIYEDLDTAPPRARLARLLEAWPVWTCLLLAVLFMLATNDPNATRRWQQMTSEELGQLSVKLESGREARQVAFVVMGAWGVATLLWPARRVRLAPALLFPILVFVAWAFVSLLWSPQRAFTAKRLVVFACLASALFGFARRCRVRDLALLALVGGALQTVFNIAFDALYATGDYGRSGYRLSGLQHPNHAGITAVLLGFGCLYFYDRTRLRRFLLLLCAAGVVLFLTKSRSALIAGLGGAAVFSLLRWPARNVALAALALAIGFCMFAALDASGVVPDDWAQVIHMGREDASSSALTGRPLIWAAAFSLFGTDPVRVLTGFGYQSFWTPAHADFVSARLQFRISEGHSAYLDTLFQLGVVGVACYVAALLGALGRWSVLARRHASGAFAFCAAVGTFAVIHGLTESTSVDPNFLTFFNYAAILFLALRAPEAWPRARRGPGRAARDDSPAQPPRGAREPEVHW